MMRGWYSYKNMTNNALFVEFKETARGEYAHCHKYGYDGRSLFAFRVMCVNKDLFCMEVQITDLHIK